jgi:hypothetical protein
MKYLKVCRDQIKQLIEAKRNRIKMATFKEVGRQNVIQKKHSNSQSEVRRKQKASWDKFGTYLEYETYGTKPKACKILKQVKTLKKQKKIKEIYMKVYFYSTMKNTEHNKYK